MSVLVDDSKLALVNIFKGYFLIFLVVNLNIKNCLLYGVCRTKNFKNVREITIKYKKL